MSLGSTLLSHGTALAIGAGVVGVLMYGCEQRDAGAWKAQRAALRAENDSLRGAAQGLETVYVARTDTLRFTRRVTDSVLAVDTVIHTDTVRQIVARERAACDAVIATCEAQKANLLAQIVNVQQQLGLEKKRGGTGTLGGFASARYDITEAVPSAKAGILLNLSRDLEVSGYGEMPLQSGGKGSLNVEAKKRWKLF